MPSPVDYGEAPDVMWRTADLCDAWMDVPDRGLRVLSPALQPFGGHARYFGPVVTVALQLGSVPWLGALFRTPGAGAVAVVKDGPDARHAILGDRMAALAVQNGWAGVVIEGRIRDRGALAALPLGIHALGTVPNRAAGMQAAERGERLDLLGVAVARGDWIYADGDGVIVTNRRHTAP